MRIHKSGIDRIRDAISTYRTSTRPRSTDAPPPGTSTVIRFIALSTSCTPTMPSPPRIRSPSESIISSSITVIIYETDADTADVSCLFCFRTSASTVLAALAHLPAAQAY
ncbi:hypothetical protein SprV_0401684600 [Sparganum proliferum]